MKRGRALSLHMTRLSDLATHPDDTDARRLLIRLLAVASDLPAARTEVELLAKSLPPGDPSAFIELGHAFELVHQFDDALAAYETASERAPGSPLGPREAGLRAAHWGEWDVARTWLEEALRRGARTPEVWHALGLVRLNLHDLDGALSHDVAAQNFARCAVGKQLAEPGRLTVDNRTRGHVEAHHVDHYVVRLTRLGFG